MLRSPPCRSRRTRRGARRTRPARLSSNVKPCSSGSCEFTSLHVDAGSAPPWPPGSPGCPWRRCRGRPAAPPRRARRAAPPRAPSRSGAASRRRRCAAVKNSARIMCCGTSRDRWVAAPSAPRSTSGRPNVASSEATMTSALPTRPMPPPTQKPLTAATTGTAHSYTARKAVEAAAVGVDQRASKPSVFCISLMSTPALKPRPSARRITTWVLGSRPAAVMASAEVEPALRRDRVDRRVVDGDRDDARFDGLGGDRHADRRPPGVGYLSKHLLGTLAQ